MAVEVEIVEVCFYCLADVGIEPGGKYVLLTKSSDSQARSVAHLNCWQVAVRKVRANE
jgi:hypothetical protein